jgi:hypothetical protein
LLTALGQMSGTTPSSALCSSVPGNTTQHPTPLPSSASKRR